MTSQQVLSFSDTYNLGEYIIVELDDNLEQFLTTDAELSYFVGGSRGLFDCHQPEETFFCTEKQTFKVLSRESSNTILAFPFKQLCEPVDKDITGKVLPPKIYIPTLFSGHLEMLLSSPRTDRLRKYLRMKNNFSNIFQLSISQILDEIQISKCELEDELKRLHIVQYKEGLRELSLSEINSTLDEIISTGVLQQWDMPSQLPPKQYIIRQLETQDPAVVAHCIDYFCFQRTKDQLCMDENAVCRFKALIIVSEQHNSTDSSLDWIEFEKRWQNITPDFFQPQAQMLSGIGILEAFGPKTILRPLVENSLPDDIESRILILFRTKSSWTLEEILPYLKPLIQGSTQIEHLLKRYCRVMRTIGSLGGGVRFVRLKMTGNRLKYLFASRTLLNRIVGRGSGFSPSPFFLICGVNVVEGKDNTLRTASHIKHVAEELRIPCIFKGSFDKANRTSHLSFRGLGMDHGLRVLETVKDELELPILTDVHETVQVDKVAEIADVLQIPSFLCRQTDLCQAAARTGRLIHLKKGEFASSTVMLAAVEKVRAVGNDCVMICERGFCFGYSDLVVDPRSLIRLRKAGCPITMDITHALQQPSGSFLDSGVVISGGERYLVPTMGRMAVAIGVDGIFMEVHEEPEKAPVDSKTQWPLSLLKPFLEELLNIGGVSRGKWEHYVDTPVNDVESSTDTKTEAS
eukprot:jgi/Galph1/4194/GphlegSOOS_G2801.1